MRFSRKHLIYLCIVLALSIFLSTYKMPYYIYKPGNANSLDSMVVVEGGYESEGSMHLLTVSGSYATPIHYLLAKVLPFREVMPISAVRHEDETDEEYTNRQLYMMDDSQHASTIVAYEAANADIEVIHNGVYVVATVKDMPANELLKSGDVIKKVDGLTIDVSEDFMEYVEGKKEGESITIGFERDGKEKEAEIEILPFPDEEGKIGIGIQLTTNIEVVVDPEVTFSSGRIGGPSAGLMFSLRIYDQLTEEDFTRGYKIAGTGQVDIDGNVYPIGGVDKKVVAADNEGSDVFFVPYEQGREGSNYDEAVKAAKKIKTKMDIVPVDTFEEALLYLENLEERIE